MTADVNDILEYGIWNPLTQCASKLVGDTFVK